MDKILLVYNSHLDYTFLENIIIKPCTFLFIEKDIAEDIISKRNKSDVYIADKDSILLRVYGYGSQKIKDEQPIFFDGQIFELLKADPNSNVVSVKWTGHRRNLHFHKKQVLPCYIKGLLNDEFIN